jgi:hypothetical protein
MSKGSTQRPRSVADEEWASRWNCIFGRDSIDDYKQSVVVDKDLPIETLRSEHERHRDLLASNQEEKS